MEESFIIYADLLLLINFVMDFLCLILTGRLLSRETKFWRITLAALVGAAYSFLYYTIYPLPAALLLFFHLLGAAAICLTAFGYKKILKTTALFIVTAAVLGGIVNAVYGISGRFSDGFYTELGAAELLLFAAVSSVAALVYTFFCKKKITAKSAKIRIHLPDTTVTAELLVDSGNLATEPFSSLPVIILQAKLFPPPLDNPALETSPIPLRLIPITTGTGSALLLGFIPEKLTLKPFFEKEREIRAAIAIDTSGLSFGTYEGLLPSSLL